MPKEQIVKIHLEKRDHDAVIRLFKNLQSHGVLDQHGVVKSDTMFSWSYTDNTVTVTKAEM